MKTLTACILIAFRIAAQPAPAAARFLSGHAAFARWAQDVGLAPARAPRMPTIPLRIGEKSLTKEIMGFWPYWSSAAPEDLRYDLLTTVAYFGASLDGNGDITNLHGWPDGTLIDLAHAAGVRVVLAVTCFDATTITTLLSSPANRANAIDNIAEQVAVPAADGVNIDFEGLPYAQKANFGAFIQELKAGLEAQLPNPYLTIDTPAVDWSGAFDYDQLASAADQLFIMAYDYHWPGGNPGPVSPLAGSATWGQYAIDWTLDDYETYLAPLALDSAILGLPLYGYDWPTVDDSVPGVKRANATAVIMARALDMAADPDFGPLHYDAPSDTPYLVYNVGGDGWHQLWFDDAESLSLRFDYSKQRGTAGIGFWALGYEGDYSGLWDEVSDAFFVPDDDTSDDTSPDDTFADDDTIPDDSIDDDLADDTSDDTQSDDSDDWHDDAAGNDDSSSDDTAPQSPDRLDDDDSSASSCGC